MYEPLFVFGGVIGSAVVLLLLLAAVDLLWAFVRRTDAETKRIGLVIEHMEEEQRQARGANG